MELNSRKLISVLIPAYNVEKYIARCLDSILSQTYKDFEVIIVDDGSTDHTLQICNGYAAQYPCISVTHTKNKGVAEARNCALNLANGEFIAWIDADDCVYPLYLEKLYDMLSETDADMAVVGYQRFKDMPPDNVEVGNNYRVVDKYVALKKMTHDFYWLVQWGKLYRRVIFDGIVYPSGLTHEDEFVMHEVYYRTQRIVYSDEPLYFYCMNDESIMGKKYSVERMRVLEAYKKRIRYYEDLGEETLAQMAILKLLGKYREHFYLVKENIPDNQIILNDLLEEYHDLFWKNKKRCGINIIKYPELYILQHQEQKIILTLLAKVKRKLGFDIW